MTNKKYTNEDIISSLKIIATTRNCNECKIRNCKWGTCNCEQITANVALDFIKRQKIENKRLEKEVNLVSIQFQDLQERYEEAQAEIESLKIFKGYAERRASDYKTMRDKYLNAKSEAYKECLAKVKNYIKTHCNPYGKPDFDYDTSIKILNFIDNLVKEMTDVEVNQKKEDEKNG